MKCQKCGNDFKEKDIQESHDVPKYMFNGDKNEADKWGRHNLCIKNHDIYEKLAFSVAFNILPEEQKQKCRLAVKEFSERYFKEVNKNGDSLSKI